MILQPPIRRTSLPPPPYLSNFILSNWNPLQHKSHHILHRFQYFVLLHSTTSHHKYWIYQIIYKAKPVRFVIKPYSNHNILWVKHATHQKAESLRTTWLTIALILMQSMLNSLQSGWCSFVFTIHLADTTNTAVLTKKQFFFSQFSLPYFTLTCSQNHLYNPH